MEAEEEREHMDTRHSKPHPALGLEINKQSGGTEAEDGIDGLNNDSNRYSGCARSPTFRSRLEPKRCTTRLFSLYIHVFIVMNDYTTMVSSRPSVHKSSPQNTARRGGG